MPIYAYKALDQQGKTTHGHLDAANEGAVATHLRDQSLYVLEIKVTPKAYLDHVTPDADSRKKVTHDKSSWLRRLKPISVHDRVFFFRQLGVMLRSGLPLLQALDVYQLQGMNPRMVESVREIIQGIQSGRSLSECMGQHRHIFPLTATKLIESGEASGELDQVMERISAHMEATAAIKNKLVTSLAYPAVVVLAAIGVGSFLTMTVIPKFTDYFSKRHMDLPASTEALMAVSRFMQDYGFFLLLAVLLASIVAILFWRRPQSRLFMSRQLIRVPVVGKVIEVSSMAQMGKTLSMLMGSGLTVTESLQVAASTTSNPSYQNGLSLSINSILRGKSLSESLERDDFPVLVKQMISVGEQTGELPQALDHLGHFYEEELQARISRMSALIEPLILLLIGGIVGFVYFAFFKAVFQIALAGK